MKKSNLTLRILKIVIAILLFLLGAKIAAMKLSSNIHNAREITWGYKRICWLHERAVLYREKNKQWPTSLSEIDTTLTKYPDRVWEYAIGNSDDTLVITATIKENPILHKKFWGAYISVDHFDNKTYSHEELKKRYLSSYLQDAKKVSSK